MASQSQQTVSAAGATGDDVALTAPDYTLFAITCFVWGTSWLGLRMQLGVVAPEVSLVWRFALAGIIVFAWAAFARQRLRFGAREHGLFAAMGVFIFSTNFVLFYYGGLTITAGLLAVVFSLASVVNFLIGIVFFGHKPEPRRLAGAGIGALGVVFLFWPEIAGTTFNREALLALGLCVLGTLCFCFGNVLSARAQRQGLPILSTNAWGMLYGTIWLVILAAVQQHPFIVEPTARYFGSLVWLAVFSSVIAFWSYLTLLGRIGGARAAYATVIFPLIALASSTLFEGYQWTVPAIIGVVLALAGNWLVLGGGKRQLVNKGG
ncbi:MAG: DMT family transporter [Devosiaceae bacterium]|nr:DMT family transporter [Devosiaceae bacterium MH13]